MITLAPDTTAPWGSVTVPRTVPRKVWANSEVEISNRKRARLDRDFMTTPLLVANVDDWQRIVAHTSVNLPATKPGF